MKKNMSYIDKGYFKEGIKFGIEKKKKQEYDNGFNEGLERGFELGEVIMKWGPPFNIIKKMMNNNESDERIHLLTGLSVDRIKQIREKNGWNAENNSQAA